MDGDIPLREAQIIWDYHGNEPDAPLVQVMGHPDDRGRDRWGRRDNADYRSSWGACMTEFVDASEDERLLMLFKQFHWMVMSKEVPPKAVHEAFLVIPEYRAALTMDFLPDEYRREREASYYGDDEGDAING